MWLKKVKQEINKLHKELGLSQAQIARLLDIPEKTLNAWLTGRVKCRHDKMLALALEALRGRLNAR